ncbi:MAG: hypothetical protein ACYDHN_05215 [Solirubrobacteraceae bacterium]
MSADPMADAQAGSPSEEELRAAYEAELSRITTTDMLGQAAVSLLNVGARRLGPPEGAPGAQEAAGQRDLEQVRDAVDGARALLEILERRVPQELGPLRDALSRLQMAYAREVQIAPPSAASQAPAGAEPPAPANPSTGEEGPATPGPGPAESSGRLWVPGR